MRRPASVPMHRLAALVALAAFAGPACFIELPERFPAEDGRDALAGSAVPGGGSADGRVATGPPTRAGDGRVDPLGPPGPRDAAPEPAPAPDHGLVDPVETDFALPPAPRAPRVSLQLVRGAHPLGCGPHDVGLAWDTTAVASCTLTTSQRGDIPRPIDALPSGQADLPAVSGRVTISIDCTGVEGGLAHDEVEVRPLANLDEIRTIPTRLQIREEQVRCARRQGHAVLPQEDANGYVMNTAASAEQICRCAGYGIVDATSEATKCYAHVTGKALGQWVAADDDWHIAPAAMREGCFEEIRCSAPVEYCDERY